MQTRTVTKFRAEYEVTSEMVARNPGVWRYPRWAYLCEFKSKDKTEQRAEFMRARGFVVRVVEVERQTVRA